MEKYLYAVKDLVAGEFGPIFIENNDASALRMCQEMFRKNDTMRIHASDYAIYRLGLWDVTTGVITPVASNILESPIGLFKEFLENEVSE